ncbi:alpha-E domain-containing protein [Fulvimarina sp. 2208YS6-2-32]|uniref:Alpha-E domain-containing protein n=1 Tax=Fulvimarina uroteuthidis TaxID=3098149 RepID=A0ABU5I4U8_9HYPH|nr:alpha-E domain-containing protein [Fulvimarina sp. 2208YS6-2-32]MDY8110404.1 alpha-E domain-containing protein [Fulvimarina sp. 2208YS6-2-32]
MALLGRTANGLFWMFRYIERAENMARLVDAGSRISMTNLSAETDEWESILVSAGVEGSYKAKHGAPDEAKIIDFLIRDQDNPSSIRSSIDTARMNGRMVRTAITREVWEAVNDTYLTIKNALASPINQRSLPQILDLVKTRCALIRGAFFGTMLRTETFDFCRLGAYLERADNTARILDVKYWMLLPEHSSIGSALDNYQWASILRSVSAHRSYAWEYDANYTAPNIIDFLMLNKRMPRSLGHCYHMLREAMSYLDQNTDARNPSAKRVNEIYDRLSALTVREVLDSGLHEFLEAFIIDNNSVAALIAENYRFYPDVFPNTASQSQIQTV